MIQPPTECYHLGSTVPHVSPRLVPSFYSVCSWVTDLDSVGFVSGAVSEFE
jgi:hypothetical protein